MLCCVYPRSARTFVCGTILRLNAARCRERKIQFVADLQGKCDQLKAINPKIKVLLSSGYSINGKATEIMARGCKGFIQKPFNMSKISLKLREILDQE